MVGELVSVIREHEAQVPVLAPQPRHLEGLTAAFEEVARALEGLIAALAEHAGDLPAPIRPLATLVPDPVGDRVSSTRRSRSTTSLPPTSARSPPTSSRCFRSS